MSEKAGRTRDQADYQSYLLRLWRAKEGEAGWRASLESAQTGQRTGFASLNALFDYVRLLTRAQSSESSPRESDVRGER